MIICKADIGNYVFKQGDLASAFFIINDGKVQVEINGEKKKILQKDDYFGELALIYGAPRSAAIQALQPSTFWCLTRNIFRQTV
jgi:cGMP-dependent protein kinase